MTKRFWVATSVFSSVVGMAALAHAGGFTTQELTSRGLARSGANIAHVADPSAQYFNPGALGKVNGFGFSGSFNFILDFATFQRDPFQYNYFDEESGTLKGATAHFEKAYNENGWLPNPGLFASWEVHKNTVIGIGLYSPPAPAVHAWGGYNYDNLNSGRCKPDNAIDYLAYSTDVNYCDPPYKSMGEKDNSGFIRDSAAAYMVEKATLVVLYPTLSIGHYFEDIGLGIGGAIQMVYANNKVRLGLDGMSGTGANPFVPTDEKEGYVQSDAHPQGAVFDEDPLKYVSTDVNAKGIGITGNVGIVYDPIPELSIGLSYRPGFTTKLKGAFSFEPRSPLMAMPGVEVNVLNDSAIMHMKMPHIIRGGINYRHLDETGFEVWDLELAATYEMWSAVKTLKTETPGPISIKTPLGVLERTVSDVDMPFNFTNTIALSLGGDYNGWRDRSTGAGPVIRGGLLWESNGVEKQYSNGFFMPFGKLALSAGFSYYFDRGDNHLLAIDVGAMYMHTFRREVHDGAFPILNPLWMCNPAVHEPGSEPDPAIMAACAEDAAAGNDPFHAVNNGVYTNETLVFSAGVTYEF